MKRWSYIIMGILLMHEGKGQKTGTALVAFTLPLVALIDLESASSKNISLVFSAPTEAGNAVALPATNSSLWLNVTSAVTATLTRQITAEMSGSVPSGLSVNLEVTGPFGSGAGTRGSPGPVITLSNSAQTVINGIGGAYTGTGISNGFQLNYSAVLQDYSLLTSGSGVFTVVFTLMDN
ncbi:hypothetical protein FQZ97_876160 [compost metagenome]